MEKKQISILNVAELLKIEECSARELLDGTIDFEAEEVYEMACCKGIAVSEMFALLRDLRSNIANSNVSL